VLTSQPRYSQVVRHLRRQVRDWLWTQVGRARYYVWQRPRYGSFLDGEVGQLEKIYIPGPPGESLWARKLSRDTYALGNNAFLFPFASGDVVRVRVRWPFIEVVDVLSKARRKVMIEGSSYLRWGLDSPPPMSSIRSR
jgi:hypothetical protein